MSLVILVPNPGYQTTHLDAGAQVRVKFRVGVCRWVGVAGYPDLVKQYRKIIFPHRLIHAHRPEPSKRLSQRT